MRLFLTFTAAVWLFACNGINYELDGTQLIKPGADDGSDAGPSDTGPVPDADSGDLTTLDMSTDLADPGDASDAANPSDMPDMPGSACAVPQPVDPARCNPTETGVCPSNGLCTLAVAAAPPPELLCVMRDLAGTGDTGDTCTRVSDCREGQTCVDWGLQEADPRSKGCARYCEIETGKGCLADEFCTTVTSQPPLDGIGWCTPACDPYDASSCPSGQTCNVDYNYPIGTCEPHFRCVTAEDFVAEGEPCGPGRMVASCAEDLICYEVQIADFRCVKPCQAAADCGAGSCSAPSGAWQLSFCQP